MEYDNIWVKLKEYISKYSIYILVFLVILVLLIILIPKNNVTESTLTLTLKGNKEVSVMKGENYIEAGYTAYDSIEGDITNRVKVIGIINKEVVGKYIIKYSITNKNGITKEEVRTINVVADLSDLSVGISYSPREITNKDVTIELKISGTGYDFTLDPDGNMITSNKVTYNVSSNDEYIFSIKRKDGTIIEKIVSIENIDKVKPIGSCKSTINGAKTEVSVTASDLNGILKYSYNFNSKKEDSTKGEYTINEVAHNVVVTVYDKAGNYELINCIGVAEWPSKTSPNFLSNNTHAHYMQGSYADLGYLLYYPDNLDLSKKNPLVVYLHGFGEFGKNRLSALENTVFGSNMKNGRFGGAIFLAPQCASSNKWRGCSKDLVNLIDDIVSKYNVDTKRISITGHSDGGAGTYIILSLYPDKFSAGAIIAGAPGAVSVDNLKKTKMVVFYGSKDHNYSNGVSNANSLIRKGVNLKLYIEDGINHDQIPHVAYEEYNVIDWLIAQTK